MHPEDRSDQRWMDKLLESPEHEKRARAFVESANNLKLPGFIFASLSSDDNELFLKAAQEIAVTDPTRALTLVKKIIEAEALEKQKTKVNISFSEFPSEPDLDAALQAVTQLAQEHYGTFLPLTKSGERTKRIRKKASLQTTMQLGMLYSSLNGYDDFATYEFS